MAHDEWTCPACTFTNSQGACCVVCYADRPGTWKCGECEWVNLPTSASCTQEGCAGRRPHVETQKNDEPPDDNEPPPVDPSNGYILPTRTASAERRILAEDEKFVQNLLDEERREQREREAAFPFTCNLCLEERPVQGSFTGDCDHRICTECFVEMVETMVQEGNADEKSLCCVQPDCRRPYSVIAIEQSLRASGHVELASTFLDLRTDQGIKSDVEHFRACPHPGCNFRFAWSQGDEIEFNCPSCENAFCLECIAESAGGPPQVGPAHPGRTCAQRKAEIDADAKAKADAEERALIAVRQEVEAMMEARCPRCKTVFEGFDGCAALRCGVGSCRAGFCALCFADCGDDAHDHVRTCPRRGDAMRDNWFLKEPKGPVWERVLNAQRKEKLQARMNGLDAGVKEKLAGDSFMQGVCRELKVQM